MSQPRTVPGVPSILGKKFPQKVLLEQGCSLWQGATGKAPLTDDIRGTLHFLYVHLLWNNFNYGIPKGHALLDEICGKKISCLPIISFVNCIFMLSYLSFGITITS
ncbi:MAG: hypothetical protein EZS28_053572, partial [Streblomastix strix]